MASTAALAITLLSLPFLIAAQNPDPAEFLKKGGQFSILLDLLTKTDVAKEIVNKINSTDGITIFAPTDNAFTKINATLAKLSADDTRKILTYHALLKYVGFKDLGLLSNPVSTLASQWTLNFTGGNNEVNVSTGVVNTKVGSPLYDNSPLGLFPIEDVLIPPGLVAAEPATAPAPAPPTQAAGPSAPSPGSGACFGRRVGWGVLVGGILSCLSLF